jgi:hypothetical protein
MLFGPRSTTNWTRSSEQRPSGPSGPSAPPIQETIPIAFYQQSAQEQIPMAEVINDPENKYNEMAIV